MTEFEKGLEAAAKTLELMATGDAIEIDGEYTWISRKTLTAAAAAIRAANALPAAPTTTHGD